MVVTPPSTHETLLDALTQVHEQGTAYWESLPLATFFAPLAPGAWSPADHVRHLTKSTRPVALAVALPRPLLLLAFGRPRRPSRSYEELLAAYQAALAGGLRANRRYTPTPRPVPDDPAKAREARATILAALGRADAELVAAVQRWPDRALDRHRLPHPALGKLTVREMLFFTIFHAVHHADVVRRRLAEAAAVAGRAR